MLIDYLCGLNKFRIYLTVSTYNDYEDLETLLKKLEQEYQVKSLADIAYTSTEEGGVLKYNVPILTIKITNAIALETIINNTFWLAETNCTYIFSFSDNVSFKNEMGKDWRGKDTEFSTILIDMNKYTTTLGIAHNAYGFYLFSNLEEYRSVETIGKQLPKYTILSEE